MNRLSLLALCAIAVMTVGNCGSSGSGETSYGQGEKNCLDGVDNDQNGLTDCADPMCDKDPACITKRVPCTQQEGELYKGGCGDIVELWNIPACIDKFCTQPADVGTDGKPQTTSVQFDVTLVGFSDAQSMVVRFLLPTTIDGKTLTCDDLITRSGGAHAVEADRRRLEDDPTLNMTYRRFISISSSETRLSWRDDRVIRANDPVIFWAEAWFGGPYEGQSVPSGNRAAFWCRDANHNGGLLDLKSGTQSNLKFTLAPTN